MELMPILDEFFMGEDEVWRNYTSSEIILVPGSEALNPIVYRFDGTLAEANGFVYASATGAQEYLTDAIELTYYSLWSDAVVTYDAEKNCYCIAGPVEFYPSGADYVVASEIVFMLEEGFLIGLSYNAEYYTVDEETYEPVLIASATVNKHYYGYGTTEIEAEPIGEGVYAQALALLDSAAPRTVHWSYQDIGFDYLISASVNYAADGSYTYETNFNGEIESGNGAAGSKLPINDIDTFAEILKTLDPDAFIKGAEEDGVYYSTMAPDYEAGIDFDMLYVAIEDNSVAFVRIYEGSTETLVVSLV